MKVKSYHPGRIEPKWQKRWEKERIFSPDIKKASKPFYNLMMFPYPSAEGLHVGNMYAFTGADIYGRFQRMQGKDVFEPIGLDGFGIHSENYALSIGEHPSKVAKRTQRNFYRQLRATGNAYDWQRTLETYDPAYYRLTQWIFIQMFKKGLAYRAKAAVNWCPSCKTVLADEQVIAGRCERCSSLVELKNLEQWFFKITKYAEKLLKNLEKIDWSERIKIAQRNWIGKSEGAEILFEIAHKPRTQIPTFTTRPDTLFGATFLVVSPDSDWVEKLTTREQKGKVAKYAAKEKKHTHPQTVERKKTGVFTGSYAINPATGEKIPIWVADYVVGGYAAGAIMGVPGHDERDFEFAKRYKLPIVKVVETKKLPYTGFGKLVNSGEWNGWKTPKDMSRVINWLERKKIGKKGVSYHLRDWLISRQRYWGPPIPMIYCKECAKEGKGQRKNMPGWYAASQKDLPVVLPYVKNYRPTGTGKSPLAQAKTWLKVKCPNCGRAARRETDVSDTFLDSAWYFLRYPSVDAVSAQKLPWDPKITQRWLPVDMYIGGAEHAVLHLMYSRFLTMVFAEWGLIEFEEPYKRFYAHGLLIAEGAKMSKSRGNIVVPDAYIKKYGADSLRCYLIFLGPFEQGGDFRDTGIEGMHRFLKRVWDLVAKEQDLVLVRAEDSRQTYKRMHQAIKRVTEDVEGLRYNRAIAGIMEFVNFLQEKKRGEVRRAKGKIRCAEWEEALRTLVLLLSPFAPHLAEELWTGVLKEDYSVHQKSWPKYSLELAAEETATVAIQVDGKLRDTLKLDAEQAAQEKEVERRAREQKKVRKYLEGKKVKKVVFVSGKLVNFVTS